MTHRFCWIPLYLMACAVRAAEPFLPLAEYEVRSNRAAIDRALSEARDAMNDDGMDQEQRILVRQFMAALGNELRLLDSLPPRNLPIATVAHGAETARYPSVGALLHDRETICSGTLVAPRAFVTARHCFHYSEKPGDFAVFLQHAGFYRIEEVIFPENPDVDVALLELREDVTGVRASALARTKTPAPARRQIAGFGVTETNARDSGIKRQGSVITRTCGHSPDIYICWDFNLPYQQQQSQSNVCSRDSGGPVGQAVDEHMATEDGVSIRISPNLDCHRQSESWSQAIHALFAWLTTKVAAVPSGITGGDSIPECCGEGVTVWARDGVLRAGRNAVHRLDDTTEVRLVRVSLNATDVPSLDLSLKIYVNRQLQDARNCSDYGRYISCEFRYPSPVPMGSWAVRVTHEAGGTGRYQLVLTMFE